MLKLTGALFIILSSAILGFYKAYTLKQRCDSLDKIIAALKTLKTEISYTKMDIKSIFMSIGDTQNLQLFCCAAEKMDTENCRRALCDSVDEQKMYLLGTDNEVLKILAENLGMTDTETQTGAIEHACIRLEEARKNAGTEYEKNSRLYRSAGILCGLLTVILLY